VDSRFVARHVHALDIARRALAGGARVSTVSFLTGMDRWTLRRYFVFDAADAPKPGRRPDSPECFIKNASLFTMIDASMVYAIYRDHRNRSPHPAEALLAAHAHYAGRRLTCELSFDRVFYVVSWTDQIWAWAGRKAIFQFATCAHCHCRYLAPLTALDNHARDCPFCKLTPRYQRDPAVRRRFPVREYPHLAAAFAKSMTSAGRSDEPS
jgi:hypothetical protein